MSGGRARAGAALRTLARLAVAAAVAGAALALLDWLRALSDAAPGGRLAYLGVLVLALLAYALLLALPYVPGVEIGLMILALQGPAAALPVYLATLAGLGLAFAAGRRTPPGWLAATLDDLGAGRGAGLVRRIAGMEEAERLALLAARLPPRPGRVLIAWRYLLLAVVLNAPGNWLIGGGGGIMLLAGLSRLFRPAPTLATVALAVAPVPLAVWALGIELV